MFTRGAMPRPLAAGPVDARLSMPSVNGQGDLFPGVLAVRDILRVIRLRVTHVSAVGNLACYRHRRLSGGGRPVHAPASAPARRDRGPRHAERQAGNAAGADRGVPFSITVRACDDTWTTVATVTNVVRILAVGRERHAARAGAARRRRAHLHGDVQRRRHVHHLRARRDRPTIPDGASAPVASIVLQGFEFSSIRRRTRTRASR